MREACGRTVSLRDVCVMSDSCAAAGEDAAPAALCMTCVTAVDLCSLQLLSSPNHTQAHKHTCWRVAL